MGCLKEHNLSDYINNYLLEYYIETGTGEGQALSFALQFPFKKYYTMDIDPDLINLTYKKTKHLNKDIQMLCGRSTQILHEIVRKIPENSPIFFFLDAQCPGADFHKCTYEESIRWFKHDAIPLDLDIKIIKQRRDVSRDVFIINNAIIYEKGDYETIQHGITWKYEWLQKELNLPTNAEFLYDAFKETHNIVKDLRSQGYFILKPKNFL